MNNCILQINGHTEQDLFPADVILVEEILYFRTAKIVLRYGFLSIIELLNVQKYQPDS